MARVRVARDGVWTGHRMLSWRSPRQCRWSAHVLNHRMRVAGTRERWAVERGDRDKPLRTYVRRSHILGMRYDQIAPHLEVMTQATMHRLLVRPKSLTDLAHNSIRQLIVGGELAMGAQLSEATLAA